MSIDTAGQQWRS